HLGGAADGDVAEHVRVAAAHLVDHRTTDVVDVEASGLARHLGMEDDLQEQIAELAAQLLRVVAIDRLGDLVGLLDDVLADRLVRLLAIPGAAARGTQPRHDLHQLVETLHRAPRARVALPRPPYYLRVEGLLRTRWPRSRST